MNRLSAVIITKNEEDNLPRCLKSLAWADEIVLVDSGSTDKTLDIARSFNCSVYVTEWLGFGKAKQFAVSKASNPWTLVVDADEEVTPALRDEITQLLQAPRFFAYRILRRSYYLGRMITHSGWQTDYTLRLFDRTKAAFNDKPVHESVQTDYPIGKIDKPLLHYTYPNLQVHLRKMDTYGNLGAENLFRKGKRSSIAKALMRAVAKFFKMYILKQGFKDGKEGLVLALMSSFGVFYKYIRLWEKCKR
ncbi:MAG: glycosyltransferase family 2 protein [Candidatus Cloacimonetes bacterium]|nr:glycosyltransferase family 2 protein [Candidatus Cloacimonadota bacterium]